MDYNLQTYIEISLFAKLICIDNLFFPFHQTTMRRFWVMLAHYHGQVFNASKIGQSLGVTHPVAGASWEGWCLKQILALMPDWRPCYY